MNVVRFQPRPERFEMRCGACDGGLWSWQVEGGETVLCCLTCIEEYRLPSVPAGEVVGDDE